MLNGLSRTPHRTSVSSNNLQIDHARPSKWYWLIADEVYPAELQLHTGTAVRPNTAGEHLSSRTQGRNKQRLVHLVLHPTQMRLHSLTYPPWRHELSVSLQRTLLSSSVHRHSCASAWKIAKVHTMYLGRMNRNHPGNRLHNFEVWFVNPFSSH